MPQKVKIEKHVASFKFAKDANKYLRLADAFLDENPEILFWTERNSSKKGLFYVYNKGLYSAVSILDIEEMLVNYEPKEPDILNPKGLSQSMRSETMNNIVRRRFFYRERFNPEGVINFTNGYFNVELGELEPHHMDIISTNQLPYDYSPFAECPNFMKALNDATEGCPYKIKIIQEFSGYCLTRHTNLEKILFLIGAAGSGKSTILEGIEAMLGKENVSNTSMEQLCQPRYAGNFIDKIANIDREIPRDISGYESALNKIISGEAIKVDTKYLPSYDARPYCKLIFGANDMPAIKDSSDSVFRRMLLIYFNSVVPKNKIDVDLKYKIREECSGIFNWAFEGLTTLMEKKAFTESQEMIKDIESLKIQNNGVYYFISECYDVDVGEDFYIPLDDLYQHYKDFCHSVGARGVYKKPMLSKEVKKIFHGKVRDGQKRIQGVNCRVWFGMKTKSKDRLFSDIKEKANDNEFQEALTWDD